MYLVTCPWEADHTEAFGAKDTAVFEDPSNGHCVSTVSRTL